MDVARGSETILLVEADPETRKLAAFMLQKRGYGVIEARSTADALQLYESANVHADLLLTEILMSGMSGPDLSARLVALQPDLRVLYMSHAEYSRVARRLEIDRERGFLQKPFTMSTLAGKVRRVLDTPLAKTAGMNV
jgi:two-component system, cell cycle sensor histidine kinase and response regulator CckA